MITILDNLRSAQNVGSIIRTSEALGVEKIYLCGITPGPENKNVLKTSLGAEQEVELERFKTTNEAVSEAISEGYGIVSLEISEKARDLKDFKCSEKIALVVGNEVSGVAEDILEQSNEVLKIEMKGKKESLNVAVAYGIAVYNIQKKL